MPSPFDAANRVHLKYTFLWTGALSCAMTQLFTPFGVRSRVWHLLSIVDRDSMRQ